MHEVMRENGGRVAQCQAKVRGQDLPLGRYRFRKPVQDEVKIDLAAIVTSKRFCMPLLCQRYGPGQIPRSVRIESFI